jgi:hypothetical protein
MEVCCSGQSCQIFRIAPENSEFLLFSDRFPSFRIFLNLDIFLIFSFIVIFTRIFTSYYSAIFVFP